nr:serine protease [Micromonospora sp. DSM 115978]
MHDRVGRAVVRILRDGEPVGCGFLVAPGSVVTCAHVVAAALDGRLQAGAAVTVDLPLAGPDSPVEAVVSHMVPDGGPDLVGLDLDPSTVDGSVRPVRVVDLDELAGRRVSTFGFPVGRPRGVWSLGVIRGRTADGRIQIEDERTQGLPLSRGFSGSPVVDTDSGAVVGMVVEVESRPARRTGYALSGHALHAGWPALGEPAAQPSPFRGLEAFQPEDAAVFFGRRHQVSQLADRLGTDGVLVVTGSSGSGKSSLVLAGLLPVLGRRRAAAVVFRPGVGTGPWTALAAGLVDHLGQGGDLAEVADLADRLAGGRLGDALNRVLVRNDLRRFLVVVDQLDDGAARFPEQTDELLEALLDHVEAQPRQPRVDLVVTAGAELFGRLLADPRFGSRLDRRALALAAPDEAHLREIVTRPLAPAGMPVYQDGLVDVLMRDVAAERNPLPLVEFTLTLLWERQERGVLTHQAYREMGGVVGAISSYAEQVWRGLPDAERTPARWLLGQLVSPLPGGRYVRRPLAAGELDDERAEAAARLAATRLVTVDTSPEGVTSVELVHEALVRHWDRLRDWVEQQRDFRSWQDDIDRQAERWRERNERDLLVRGSALRQARTMAAAHLDELTDGQRRFISASLHDAIRRWMLRGAAASLVLSLVVSLVTVGVVIRGREAQRQAVAAATQLLGTGGANGPDKLRLDVRAYRTHDNDATRQRLRDWYRNLRYADLLVPNEVWRSYGEDVNPAGTRALSTAGPRDVQVYDLTADPPVAGSLPIPEAERQRLTWLGDDLLAVGGRDVVTVWDARTGAKTRTVAAVHDQIEADSTGRWLGYGNTGERDYHVVDLSAATPVERVVRLPSELAPIRQGGPDDTYVLAVLDTGEVLLNHDGRREVLSPAGSRPMDELPLADVGGARGRSTVVRCVEGQRVELVAAATAAVLASHEVPEARCSPQSGAGTRAVFSADGRHVALTGRGATTGVLEVGAVGAILRRVSYPTGFPLAAVHHEPSGGYRLVLGSSDALLQMRVPPPDPLDLAVQAATRTAVTADGRLVVLWFTDDRVETWDPQRRRRVAAARVPREPATPGPGGGANLALSRDGRLAVVAPHHSRSVFLLRLPGLETAAVIDPPGSTGSTDEDGTPIVDAAQIEDIDPAGRVLMSRASTLTVWSSAGEPLSGRISPGYLGGMARTALLRPGHAEVVYTLGTEIVRYRFADGAEVPGSRLSIGDDLGNAVDSTDPVLDDSGRYLAILRTGVLEVWDLDAGRRDGHLAVQGRSVTGLAFEEDPDRVRLDIGGSALGDPATIAQRWDRSPFLGIPRRVGLDSSAVIWLSDEPDAGRWAVEPGRSGAPFALIAVEPTDPRAWLDRVCAVLSRAPAEVFRQRLPDGAYRGPVCEHPN